MRLLIRLKAHKLNQKQTHTHAHTHARTQNVSFLNMNVHQSGSHTNKTNCHLYQSNFSCNFKVLKLVTDDATHHHMRSYVIHLHQTLTPCGHSGACRSSSRWRDQQRLGSRNGQMRSPWSRSHRKPPVAQKYRSKNQFKMCRLFVWQTFLPTREQPIRNATELLCSSSSLNFYTY